MTRCELKRAIAQALCLVERAQQQRGMAQPMVGPGEMDDEAACSESLDERLALAEMGERLARLAEMRQGPGGESDRHG